jgi:anti-sigma B factor antagonist
MSAPYVEQIDGVPIAHVNEDIDVANATAIQQRLADALGPDALSLVVDLSATQYIDSAGVDMLLRLSDLLDHRRAKLILVIPDTSQLKRLATIVGLPEVLVIHPSLTDAVQEAARAQAQSTASHPDSGPEQASGAGTVPPAEAVPPAFEPGRPQPRRDG